MHYKATNDIVLSSGSVGSTITYRSDVQLELSKVINRVTLKKIKKGLENYQEELKNLSQSS